MTEGWMPNMPESEDFEIRPLAPSDPRTRRLNGMLDRLQISLYPAESNHLDPVETLEHDDATFLAAASAARCWIR